MAEQKIAIIGRGLAGLSLAFRMVERGFRPMIFGAPGGPTNASRCAQGIVCNKGLIFAESPLFRAKLEALKRLEPWLSRLESISSQSIPRSRTGVDEPYWNEDDFRKTVDRVYKRHFWGCYRPQNLAAESHEGFKTPAGYFRYPDDAWFDVDAALNALEKACENRGSLFIAKPIKELQASQHGIHIETEDRNFTVDHLTVAAGAESVRLLEMLGVSCPRYFQVAGQSLSWAHPQRASCRILVKGMLSLAVLPDRKILGSSSWKPDPHGTPDLSADRVELLRQAESQFGLRLDSIDAASLESRWGTRLRFVDRMPALGIWPDDALHERVSVLTGFYKNGLQLADLCAEQLLRELLGQARDAFGEAFHVSRLFQKKRPAETRPKIQSPC